MPARATTPDGCTVYAFDLDDAAWVAVKLCYRDRRQDWILPCCNSPVVAKQSRRGARFFAHYARNGCDWQGETEHHLRLKRLVVEAARRNGWTADTEVTGASADGEAWKADVLATRGTAKVAVEVQWSSQTDDALMARQARYARAGIRGLWLIRGAGYPVSHALPAVTVGQAGDASYVVSIPANSGASVRRPYDWVATHIPAADFLDAAFAGRFRWGVRIGDAVNCSLEIATIECWRCRAVTSPVTGIVATAADATAYLTIYDFEGAPGLLDAIVPGSVRHDHRIGPIAPRFSQTESRRYLSNGCVAWGALLGRFFEHEFANEATVRHVAQILVDEQWKRLLEEHLQSHWRVIRP